MRFHELVTEVATESGCSKEDTARVLRALAPVARTHLAVGRQLRLPGLVTLSRTWRQPGKLRNVHDGRRIALDGRWAPQVRVAAALRAALAATTPQLLRHPTHQDAWRLAAALVSDVALYNAPKTPRGLRQDMDASEVDRICLATFGKHWQLARDTYQERTQDFEMQGRDYLADAARERWAVFRLL